MNKLNHIAFIMDGNGRWGKKNRRGRNYGHLKGVETVKKIVKGAIKLKVPIVTFYVFSSENWRRPKSEILFLFKLIKNYFNSEIKNVISQGIRINILAFLATLQREIPLYGGPLGGGALLVLNLVAPVRPFFYGIIQQAINAILPDGGQR